MKYLHWLVLILAIAPAGAIGQDSDQEMWLDQAFTFRLNRKTSLRLLAFERFDKNITDLFISDIQVGVGYQALPWLAVTPSYGHAWNNTSNANASYENRTAAEIIVGTIVNRWRPVVRTHLEGKYLKDQRGFFRLRLRPGIQYALRPSSRFAPAFMVENEFIFDNRALHYKRNRIRAGVPFRAAEHLSLTPYFMVESTKLPTLWDHDKILGLTMSWDY